jgi:hypothetical protein
MGTQHPDRTIGGRGDADKAQVRAGDPRAAVNCAASWNIKLQSEVIRNVNHCYFDQWF